METSVSYQIFVLSTPLIPFASSLGVFFIRKATTDAGIPTDHELWWSSRPGRCPLHLAEPHRRAPATPQLRVPWVPVGRGCGAGVSQTCTPWVPPQGSPCCFVLTVTASQRLSLRPTDVYMNTTVRVHNSRASQRWNREWSKAFSSNTYNFWFLAVNVTNCGTLQRKDLKNANWNKLLTCNDAKLVKTLRNRREKDKTDPKN